MYDQYFILNYSYFYNDTYWNFFLGICNHLYYFFDLNLSTATSLSMVNKLIIFFCCLRSLQFQGASATFASDCKTEVYRRCKNWLMTVFYRSS